MGSSGTEWTMGECGGRGSASPFPAKGRRTRAKEARTSISGSPGNDLYTWWSWRSGGESCERGDHARAAPVSGGSGQGKFRRRGGQSWTGLS
jgi:hypothetical protein